MQKPGQYCSDTGDFLGDLTDKLEDFGPGAYISKFVSGGPKNYAFEVRIPNGPSKYVAKVKGFTLNSEVCKSINFHSIKRLVLASVQRNDDDVEVDQNSIIVKNSRIIRNGIGNLQTKLETKTYRVVNRKRKLLEDLTSVPWGYSKKSKK